MARVQLNELIVTTGTGNALAGADGASISIRHRGTATTATIYQAATGASTWTQPLTTAAGGIRPVSTAGDIWIDEGRYDLVITPAGGGTAVTRRIEPVTGTTQRVLNVMDAPYLAKGDGTTDDVTAIQAAITDAQQLAATGGPVRVYFPKPPNRYRLTATTTAGGLTWHLAVTGSGVTLDFEDGATLYSTADASLIFITGYGKPAGAASWTTYWLGTPTNATYHAITDPAKGDTTLTSAALAATVTTGDYIHVRTGQVVSGARVTEPDAEINAVEAISGSVITLRWPIGKPYAQEYFVSGTQGLTSTAVTANLATYGAAKVTDRIITGIQINGLTIESTGIVNAGQAIQALGVDNLRIHRLRGSSNMSVVNNIECNRCDFQDWDVVSRPTTTGLYRWVFGCGSTGGRHTIRNIRGRGAGTRMLVAHIHEGQFDSVFQNIRVTSPAGNNDNEVMSVRGRAYGIAIRDSEFVCASTTVNAGVVSSACTGDILLDNVRGRSADPTKGITVQNATTRIVNNPPANVIVSTTQAPLRAESPRPFDTKLKAWPYPSYLASGTVQPTTGTTRYTRCPIPDTITIANAHIRVSTTATSATLAKIAVFAGIGHPTLASGDLIARTATQHTDLNANTGVRTWALTAEAGKSLTLTGGPDVWYYLAYLQVGGTAAILNRLATDASLYNGLLTAAEGFHAATSTGGQTDITADITISGLTANDCPWIGLS